MTTRSTSRTLPSVALRGRSASAWLGSGAIILEERQLRRRIPMEAVEAAVIHRVVFLGVPMLVLGLWLIRYQMVELFLL